MWTERVITASVRAYQTKTTMMTLSVHAICRQVSVQSNACRGHKITKRHSSASSLCGNWKQTLKHRQRIIAHVEGSCDGVRDSWRKCRRTLNEIVTWNRRFCWTLKDEGKKLGESNKIYTTFCGRVFVAHSILWLDLTLTLIDNQEIYIRISRRNTSLPTPPVKYASQHVSVSVPKARQTFQEGKCRCLPPIPPH
jgi:hypothetical protein